MSPAEPTTRLGREELLRLLKEAPLCEIGAMAHAARLEKTDPGRVTYIKDRNINYTNICVSGCRFCAFFKKPGQAGGYVITEDELAAKIEEAMDLGAVQILLQGGLNPDFGLDRTTAMLRFIKSRFKIHVHGFSPPEICHLAGLEKMAIEEVLDALRSAGLDSMPGGGAEILTKRERDRVSPGKCTAAQWLKVMEKAHGLGLRTTATMMFGHGEAVEDRVDHLLALRELQDLTGGFTAFIPWTFQPRNTRLSEVKPLTSHAYLEMLALSRLALDNVEHLQVSWVTQGERLAQTALFFGADDFGSTMIEENVVAAAGVHFRLSVERIETLIRTAGFCPALRNQAYDVIEERGGGRHG